MLPSRVDCNLLTLFILFYLFSVFFEDRLFFFYKTRRPFFHHHSILNNDLLALFYKRLARIGICKSTLRPKADTRAAGIGAMQTSNPFQVGRARNPRRPASVIAMPMKTAISAMM